MTEKKDECNNCLPQFFCRGNPKGRIVIHMGSRVEVWDDTVIEGCLKFRGIAAIGFSRFTMGGELKPPDKK